MQSKLQAIAVTGGVARKHKNRKAILKKELLLETPVRVQMGGTLDIVKTTQIKCPQQKQQQRDKEYR